MAVISDDWRRHSSESTRAPVSPISLGVVHRAVADVLAIPCDGLCILRQQGDDGGTVARDYGLHECPGARVGLFHVGSDQVADDAPEDGQRHDGKAEPFTPAIQPAIVVGEHTDADREQRHDHPPWHAEDEIGHACYLKHVR